MEITNDVAKEELTKFIETLTAEIRLTAAGKR